MLSTIVVQRPTIKPRNTAPVTKPMNTSIADKGGIKTSIMFPCTFDITNEEEVFENAFCTIVIITSPGPRKARNEMPPI